MSCDKPSIETVIAYAKPLIFKYIHQKAGELPDEIKEDIEQNAYIRIIEAYKNLDETKGWKSFVYNHSRGAVLDFLKFGKGFEESKWSLRNGKNTYKLRDRIDLVDQNGDECELDEAIGRNGIFSEIGGNDGHIRWELVSRMASHDEAIHAVAKFIRGFRVDEIAHCFDISKPKAGQLIKLFIERFDDEEIADDPWFLQTCYAFGICEHFDMKDIDQSEVLGFPVGWSCPKVDLDSNDPFNIHQNFQLSFFDLE